jgi:hypothetical protein
MNRPYYREISRNMKINFCIYIYMRIHIFRCIFAEAEFCIMKKINTWMIGGAAKDHWWIIKSFYCYSLERKFPRNLIKPLHSKEKLLNGKKDHISNGEIRGSFLFLLFSAAAWERTRLLLFLTGGTSSLIRLQFFFKSSFNQRKEQRCARLSLSASPSGRVQLNGSADPSSSA